MPSPLPEWKPPDEAHYDTTRAIIEACRQGRLDEYAKLASEHATAVPPPPSYLVYLAANSGSGPLTEHLLSRYPHNFEAWTTSVAQPDSQQSNEEIVLWGQSMDHCEWLLGLAISYNHPDLVLRFVEAGADINKRWSFESAFTEAIASNCPTMVRYLAELGTAIEGSLALWTAAADGNIEIGKILLELGADINEIHFDIGYTLDDKDEFPHTILGTALHASHSLKQPAFTQWLLDNGADPTLKDGYGRTPDEVDEICEDPFGG